MVSAFIVRAHADGEAKKITGAKLRAADFQRALLKLKVPQAIEAGCLLLTLPDDDSGRPVFWPGIDSNRLFVRSAFPKFFDEVLQKFEMAPTSKLYRTLMLGVPGIGKSSFGL